MLLGRRKFKINRTSNVLLTRQVFFWANSTSANIFYQYYGPVKPQLPMFAPIVCYIKF